MPPNIYQSVGLPHILPRLTLYNLSVCCPEPGAVHNLYAVPESPGSAACSQRTRCLLHFTGQGQPEDRSYLGGGSPRNSSTLRWWGRGTDIKQELFLNTCWSLKTQWHFYMSKSFQTRFYGRVYLEFCWPSILFPDISYLIIFFLFLT